MNETTRPVDGPNVGAGDNLTMLTFELPAEVADVNASSIRIENETTATETATETTTDSVTATETRTDGGPGFGVVLAFVAAAGLARRRKPDRPFRESFL